MIHFLKLMVPQSQSQGFPDSVTLLRFSWDFKRPVGGKRNWLLAKKRCTIPREDESLPWTAGCSACYVQACYLVLISRFIHIVVKLFSYRSLYFMGKEIIMDVEFLKKKKKKKACFLFLTMMSKTRREEND
ncbi:hypothetical protein CEXT_615341 [Caerostris extrusa]|uniref:Uncharacterized protein n=1 Tax=Caerostris extrusa TaxID=172846 RepID=A0AAV4RIR2_CAEEX|nr:hypothetical protein CEXT_615341 [Caerostris extrusa]